MPLPCVQFARNDGVNPGYVTAEFRCIRQIEFLVLLKYCQRDIYFSLVFFRQLVAGELVIHQ